jgi:hypothetical protein
MLGVPGIYLAKYSDRMHAPNVERSAGSILDTINAHSLESGRLGNRRKEPDCELRNDLWRFSHRSELAAADLFTANAFGRIPNESLRKIRAS